MADTTDGSIEINGLEYGIVQTTKGWCDNCDFYKFDEANKRLEPCHRQALRLCIQRGVIFVKQGDNK